MKKKVIKVLIVDDHEVVRMGLRSLLNREGSVEVVAEAGSVAEAVEMASKFSPAVVVMDIRLPDGSGVEACREIRALNPKVQVIMLTSYADDEAVLASIMAGAAGYFLKQTSDPAVTQTVLERMKRLASGQQFDEITALSAQERKVLALVADGKTNKEIANALDLSDKTVKNYLSNIFSKLNLSRRAEAAA
ncbi:MAG: response regulator transcription factor, partial [Deltaproteobacteria bacterium]|nr:response regulator transcription factor [Deltaproteobacteria bacterium]